MKQYEWTIGEGKMVEGSNKPEEGGKGMTQMTSSGMVEIEEELVVKVGEAHMVRKSLEDQMETITTVSSTEDRFHIEEAVKESMARHQSANVDAVMRVRELVVTKINDLESKREKHRRSSNMYIALDEQILHWARFSASLSTLIEDL